ncbi:cell division suppressor protein YneA [Defluviitalea phaphyphila]|uniref:cell division suppressor protein YneA n=1 Tax=Defluviitalea phaphyphila TaxID=1473580 RepID=UPI000730DE65|nr:LysM peptidoglycan-binding domain-containing protein [Defluviitalea phaphyphila]
MRIKKLFKKYRLFLLLVLFICIFQVFFIVVTYSFTEEKKQTYNPIKKYKQVRIKKGDTLWDIAKEYKPENQSINQYINYIKEFNNMKSYDIYAGDNIIIPIYKEK